MLKLPAIEVDAHLNATKISNVETLPQVRRALSQLDDGKVLKISMDCQSNVDDLKSWCQQMEYEILHTDKQATDKCIYYVQKGHPVEVTVNLNTGNQACPVPVIEAARAISHMTMGEVLKLSTACPGALDDVESWINNSPHRICAVRSNSDGAYLFYIEKLAVELQKAA